jgi:peptide/nickel transport system permease protein
MIAYVIRRLLSTLIVMGVVGIFVFLLLHLSPGDPAAIIAGDNATSEQIDGIRAKLGLDDPLLVQFLRWVGHVVQGDLGISIFSNEPVLKLVGQRIEPTISLALTTLFVAVVLAVTFGVLAAWKAGTIIDRLLMVISVIGFSVPVFVVGYLLIYVFAINLRWLPVQGYTPIAEGLGGWIRSLVLPSIALGLAYVALIARITRATMLEVLEEDYIRTAIAKGVSNRSMLLKHALRNAGVPIVTIIGIGVALLISGVVITETVFNIPGVGRLVVDAIAKRDYPIIQGVILIFSGVYVLINLTVDLTYMLLDPRIRYQ